MTHAGFLVERALRVAARAHDGQCRKATDLPYFTHPAAVALILAKAGFHDEGLLAAALLHDVVEDTDCTLADLAGEFPAAVVTMVSELSETKHASDGSQRPWIDRKREYIERVSQSSRAVRAIALADKLHNLTTILFDLQSGEPVWERFNAAPDRIFWYHETLIERLPQGDPDLEMLARHAHDVLEKLRRNDSAR